jgi:hypothetical protein
MAKIVIYHHQLSVKELTELLGPPEVAERIQTVLNHIQRRIAYTIHSPELLEAETIARWVLLRALVDQAAGHDGLENKEAAT